MSRVVHPCAAGAAESLRFVQEPHRDPGEAVHRTLGVALSGGDDKDTGHVVGAVAALAPGLGQQSVLEGAATVGQPQQMVEYRSRRRRGHTRARRCVWTRCARLRYALATTGRAISGANRRASAAMSPASRGCVSTRRRADARASGSSWPTTMPAPLERSSTACGNAVATTGLPLAMASTSTPEVT